MRESCVQNFVKRHRCSSDGQIVVLLDESEVFLEERSQADLQRNALVSVFLRAMEYYDGILILTSNRGEKWPHDESETVSG